MKFRRPKDKNPRQATHTGSAKVFSYYANRAPVNDASYGRHQSAKSRKSRRFFNWQTFRVAVAITAMIISAGYFLWLDTNPRIEVTAASDEKRAIMQTTDTYRKAGQEILSQSSANRFKLTVDTNKVEQQMKARFPELAEVVVTTPVLGHKLVFKVQPTDPAVVLSSNKPGFIILDGRGRAVYKTTNGEVIRKLQIPLVIDESGLEVAVGDTVLPAENIRFITEVIKQLQAKNVTPQTVILPLIAHELHIRPANLPYFVKFNLVGDPRLQAGAFIASKQKLEGEGKTPSQYVDVRTHEKVFYQ